jgi:hypothetical protein
MLVTLIKEDFGKDLVFERSPHPESLDEVRYFRVRGVKYVSAVGFVNNSTEDF